MKKERKELSFIYSFLNRVIQPNYTTYSNLVNREKKSKRTRTYRLYHQRTSKTITTTTVKIGDDNEMVFVCVRV